MKLPLFCFLMLFSISLAAPCSPLWPRIFYGQSVSSASSTDKLVIYFNTAQPCTQSYIQIVTKGGMTRVNCETTSLSLSKNTNHYQTHIHKCHTDAINYEETFFYNVFGWDGSSSNPIPYGDFIDVKMADPFNVYPS
jgi:hypothetical protein